MIQLGSILAIMWLYRQRIWDVITGLPTKPEARRFALMLFFAFLPAAFVGLIANSYIRNELYLRLDIIAMRADPRRLRDAGDREVAAED